MISVVIPAFNEEKNIGRCLESLVQQDTTEEYEVILVDNGSTDNTVSVAKKYQSSLRLRVVQEKVKGRGAARKKGFEEAAGEIIFSTDSDTVLPPSWISSLIKKLTESDSVAVSGTCKIDDCSIITNTTFNILQPLCMRLYRVLFGHYWLSGFNFAIYGTAYRKSGGFSSELNALEDTDLAKKVSKIGKISFFSNPSVTFSGRRFKKGLLIGLFSYIVVYFNYSFRKEKTILSDVR